MSSTDLRDSATGRRFFLADIDSRGGSVLEVFCVILFSGKRNPFNGLEGPAVGKRNPFNGLEGPAVGDQ